MYCHYIGHPAFKKHRPTTGSHLDEGHEAVNLPIEGAAMQGGPPRLFVLHQQVGVLAVQEPLKQVMLTQGSCEVESRASV